MSRTAFVQPPDGQPLLIATYSRARARRMLAEIPLLPEPPRVVGVVRPDRPDRVTLVLWFRRPTDNTALLLLGAEPLHLVDAGDIAVGPGAAWATGRALTRLLCPRPKTGTPVP